MGARALLHQWRLRLAGRLAPWVVAAVLLAGLDVMAGPAWGLCALQVAICLLALQMLSRPQIPQLILVLLVFTIVPYVLRPPYHFEPIRVWVILALLAAAFSHLESQRRRKRRLYVRQQLQRRVRRRTLQIRRINEVLRREITRRQATQQRLTRAEMHLQSLAQRMRLQVIRKDLNGVITYANDAFCRGLGRPLEEVIGATDADLYPPALASAYRYDDERVIRTGQTVDHIESHPTAGGKTGWVQVFKAPEYDDQNHVTGVQIVFWDVTETYRKTAELRRSEARKRALFDAAREAVLLVDEAGVVVEANPAAEQLLTTGTGPLAGQRLAEIAVPETALPSLGEALTNLIEAENDEPYRGGTPDQRVAADQGEDVDRPHDPGAPEPRGPANGPNPLAWSDLPYGERREVLLRPAKRATFPAEVSVHPIPLENSIGLAIFVRDVTLRHQALEALQQAKVAAEEASRIKSEFMASVSHEIRTPLGGITGSVELLCQMDLPPKALQYVDMIRHSGELLSSVIGDILDFTSIEAGRLQITPAPTDVHRCVGEAFRSLATRAMGKDLELVLSIMPEVPRYLMVDANRLQQVVINLAGNAIKFTPAGYVLLRVGVESGPLPSRRAMPAESPRGEEQQWLRLEMIDSGIGIPSDQQEKIFEPFEQGDSGTTRHYGGTGLGLSISDKLVRRMGGGIQVISRPEHGSTFRCFIPLQPVTPPPAAAEPLPTAAGQAVALQVRHPVQRKAIGDLLLANGFRIDSEATTRIVDQALAQPRVPGQRRKPGEKVIWIARVDEPALPDQDPRQPILLKPILADDLLRLLHSDASQELTLTQGRSAPRRPARLPRSITPASSGAAPDDAAPAAEQAAGLPPGSPGAWAFHPPALLVVDDSPVNQAVIRDFLVGAGFQVELASCGQEALQATQRQRFACVLMDLQMPGMDGIETMRQIVQACERRQQTPPPFIALTAHATEEHRQRCLREGMKAFLVKPIDREALIETVTHWAAAPVPNEPPGDDCGQDAPAGDDADEHTGAAASDGANDAGANDAGANESGANESGANESGANESGANESGANESGANESGANESGANDPGAAWRQRLIDSAGGDPDTLQALIEAFLIEVPQLCQDLERALPAGDATKAGRAAHTLKSCLRYVAPEADWQQAAELEQALRQDDLLRAAQLAPAVIQVAGRWLERLQAEAADR